MNPNQPAPNPSPRADAHQTHETVMKKLRSDRWKGRALTSLALGTGLLSIVGGIFLIWVNSVIIFPQVQLLLRNIGAAQSGNTNSMPQTNVDSSMLTLSDGT